MFIKIKLLQRSFLSLNIIWELQSLLVKIPTKKQMKEREICSNIQLLKKRIYGSISIKINQLSHPKSKIKLMLNQVSST